MGDITAEGDASGVPTPNESYQYDPLYRLQEVDDATGAPWQSYTYNKTGDRLSKTTAGQTPADTYSYTPDTHQLIGIAGYDASSRAMDANGNTSAFQANGWMYGLGYNDASRLSLVQQNGTTIVAYRLDGKGERVRKLPAGAAPIEYVYDEAGRLLYEYTGPSQNRSYVWADNTLVATVEDNAAIHYVYTDHLGTPRVLTTTTGTPIWAWPWLQNPFGEKPASGAGGYTFNLRYPGQYYDQETGLNYNGHRDYESGTGRYVQSDPIGLLGGINSYVYGGNNSISRADPSGLANFLAGVGGNAVAGLGGHASGGVYLTLSWSSTPIDMGVYTSAGPQAGFNGGVDNEYGYVQGNVNDIRGITNDVSGALPGCSATAMYDASGNLVGFMGGPAADYGLSGGTTVTNAVGLNDLGDWLGNYLYDFFNPPSKQTNCP